MQVFIRKFCKKIRKQGNNEGLNGARTHNLHITSQTCNPLRHTAYMDMIFIYLYIENPSKSEVIGRCGGDEKTELLTIIYLFIFQIKMLLNHAESYLSYLAIQECA